LVEKAAWLGGMVILQDGRGRHFDAVRHPDHLPDAALHSGQLEAIKTRVKEYMIAFLVLETLMIGVFCALDIVLFYIFFEGGLIPMFIIIGVWGGKRRIYASLQVLPLHAARLGADAARHHGDVLERRHDRHRTASGA
jgi:NADH-quinone oxidoreductase subunit M